MSRDTQVVHTVVIIRPCILLQYLVQSCCILIYVYIKPILRHNANFLNRLPKKSDRSQWDCCRNVTRIRFTSFVVFAVFEPQNLFAQTLAFCSRTNETVYFIIYKNV